MARRKEKKRPLGILDLLVAHAHNIPNRMPSNGPYAPRQDVYVQIFGGRTPPSKQTLKTRKSKEGGSEPIFNETMQLCILEEDAEITCQVWMASYSRGSHLDVMLAYLHIPVESFLMEDQGRNLKTFALTNSDRPEEDGGVIALGLKFRPSIVSAVDPQAPQAAMVSAVCSGVRPSTGPMPVPAVRTDGSLLASLRAALGRHTTNSASSRRGSKRSSPDRPSDETPMVTVAESGDMPLNDSEGLDFHSDRVLKKGRPLGMDIVSELKKVVGEIVIPVHAEGEFAGQKSTKSSSLSVSELQQGILVEKESLQTASLEATFPTSGGSSQELRFGSLTLPDLDLDNSPRSRRNLSSWGVKVLEDLRTSKGAERQSLWQKDVESPGALFFWGETQQVTDGVLEEVLRGPQEVVEHTGGGIQDVGVLQDEFPFNFDSYEDFSEPEYYAPQAVVGVGTYGMVPCESSGSVKQACVGVGSDGEVEGGMKVGGPVLLTTPTPLPEKPATNGQKQLLWQRRLQKNGRKRCDRLQDTEGQHNFRATRREGTGWQPQNLSQGLVSASSTLQEQFSRSAELRERAT